MFDKGSSDAPWTTDDVEDFQASLRPTRKQIAFGLGILAGQVALVLGLLAAAVWVVVTVLAGTGVL